MILGKKKKKDRIFSSEGDSSYSSARLQKCKGKAINKYPQQRGQEERGRQQEACSPISTPRILPHRSGTYSNLKLSQLLHLGKTYKLITSVNRLALQTGK